MEAVEAATTRSRQPENFFIGEKINLIYCCTLAANAETYKPQRLLSSSDSVVLLPVALVFNNDRQARRLGLRQHLRRDLANHGAKVAHQ